MGRIGVSVPLLLAAMIQGDTPPEPNAAGTVSVRIVPSSFRDKTGRAIELYSLAHHFHVVITNVSKEPVRLWREWCGWGYFTLSFTVTDEGGKTITVKKRPRGWDKNYPDWSIIPPGDHMIFEVSFKDSTWEGTPLPETRGSRQVRMQAVYTVPTDEQTKEHGIWTGTVSSPADTYTIYR